MPKPWPPALLNGKTTAIVRDGRRKVHTVYECGTEIVNEYDIVHDRLLLRKVRQKTKVGGIKPWYVEIGEPSSVGGAAQGSSDSGALLLPSASSPLCVRIDTDEFFQFRIRNLPYPADVYSVTVDKEERELVVRTSNKKYFKRLSITDLERMRITPANDHVSYSHQNNTLIISYRKPAAVLAKEQDEREQRRKMALQKQPAEGDVDCKNQ